VTIQDLGSIGELVAAVATVVTLAYLALQIRQHSNSSRAEAARGTVDGNAAMLAVAQDPELTRIFVAGLSDFDALDPIERTRFAYTFGSMIGSVARHYENVSLGILDETHFKSHNWGHLMMLETPGGSQFWHALDSTFPPEFRDFVLREVKVRPPVPSGPRASAAQQGTAADKLDPGAT